MAHSDTVRDVAPRLEAPLDHVFTNLARYMRKLWDEDGILLDDTNVSGIGSVEDKELRKQAAKGEPAWKDVGDKPGVWIWRVEDFNVVPWPRQKHGDFHVKDSYVVLHVTGGVGPTTPEQFRKIERFLGDRCAVSGDRCALSRADWMGAFSALDSDADGAISRKEWFVRRQGQEEAEVFDMIPKRRFAHVTRAEWEELFIAWDVGQAGEVDLRALGAQGDPAPIERDIYFWLGADTAIDQRGVAAYKTVELDDLFDGTCTQHREVQGQESEGFQHLFKSMRYLAGGAESGFDPAQPLLFKHRLYQVTMKKKNAYVMQEVTVQRSSLNHRDCFILDLGELLYVWCGDDASHRLKFACEARAKALERERWGRAKVRHEADDDFWNVLGGEGPVTSADEAPADVEPDFGEGVLFKMFIDEARRIQVEEVGRRELDRSMLDDACIMILDTRTELFLWHGKHTTELERRNAMKTAVNYLRMNGRCPQQTAIHVFKNGNGMRNKTWAAIFPHTAQ